MNEKICCIVPIYNVKDYLKECLDSIVNQTYKNLSIILIDDGSKDNSLDIAKQYVNDRRVMIISKDNGGLSNARNAGIDFALNNFENLNFNDMYFNENYIDEIKEYFLNNTQSSTNINFSAQNIGKSNAQDLVTIIGGGGGQYYKIDKNQFFSNATFLNIIKSHNLLCNYIIWLDSDDYFKIDAIAKLHDSIKNNNTLLSFGNIINFKIINNTKIEHENKIIAHNKINSLEYLRTYKDDYFSKPAGYLVHRDLLKNIRFIDGIINEDCPFGFDLFLQDFNLSILEDIIFEKRERDGSISHKDSFNNIGFEKIKYSFFIICNDLLKKASNANDEKIKNFIIKILKYNVNGLMIYSILSHERDWHKVKKFAKFMKIKHLVYIFCPKIYFIFFNIKQKIKICTRKFH